MVHRVSKRPRICKSGNDSTSKCSWLERQDRPGCRINSMLTKGQPSTRSGEPALTVVEELAPRRSRKIQFLVYVGLLILFGLVIVFTLEWGQLWLQPHAPSPALVVKQTVSPSSVDYSWIWAGLYRNISTPLSRLLLQFIIIIGATRTLGTIFSRIGQPAVIGEIAAGILLSPSLFGWVCPNVFRFVFSTDSLVGLRLFSQVGVCLFMFEAGSLPAIECAVKSCPN